MGSSSQVSSFQAFGLRMSIVLVGMMGVGKTSIGKYLAQGLDVDFYDSDLEIEQASGFTIVDYFAKYGESAFRVGERQVIARLLKGPPIVLSTGGGAFIEQQTRKIIQDNSLSVWIKADKELVLGRVKDSTHRPLLHGGNIEEKVETLLKVRTPIYAKADLNVNVDAATRKKSVLVAKHIMDEVNAYYVKQIHEH